MDDGMTSRKSQNSREPVLCVPPGKNLIFPERGDRLKTPAVLREKMENTHEAV